MKVIVTKHAGFCFGVRRSLELLDEAVQTARTNNRKAVMLGPIIHNPRLIEQYRKEGVNVVTIDAIPPHSIVIVRSHGITKQQENYLKERTDITVVDTTCPFVKRIYDLVTPFTSPTEGIIVLGSSTHAEVQALVSRITVSYMTVSPDEIEQSQQAIAQFLSDKSKVLTVAQTTSQPEKYDQLLSVIDRASKNKPIDIIKENTVCNATQYRQNNARKTASSVDAMIVIGGFNSSNTRKLFLVVKDLVSFAKHIESPNNFTTDDIQKLAMCNIIGVTAGASTPDDQIKELALFLERL